MLLTLAGACKDEGVTEPGVPGVAFVAGASASDTIDAILNEELIVEVRSDGGRPAAGLPVRFTTIVRPNLTYQYLYISRSDALDFGGVVDDTTDASGHASVKVKLGGSARTAIVIAAVPSLGLADTASVTVRPGAATDMLLYPLDAQRVIQPGQTVTVRAITRDRNVNVRRDPATYSIGSGGVRLQDSVVTALTSGSAEIIAHSMGLSDTVTLAIVPAGPLAVAATLEVATIELDGSRWRSIANVGTDHVRWAPDGASIAFNNRRDNTVGILTMNGDVRPLRPSRAEGDTERYPAYSPDGAWVYMGVVAQGSGSSRLWRVRPDGTDAAPLVMSDPQDASYPSPSPDGTRLVYVHSSAGDKLRILDLEMGAILTLDVPGNAPAWSPLGDLIAYVDVDAGAVLMVMRPDGTGRRRISPSGDHELSVQWSPDGRWLVGKRGSIAYLTDVVTGATIPALAVMGEHSPTWSPRR